MICRNCGNEIRDDVRFCPHCGALNSPDQSSALPQGAASYSAPAWEGPEGGGGKKKIGLVIGIAVAAVVAIALLAIVLRGLFSNPKKQVEAAFAKSAAAYLAAEEKLGMPDVAQWQQDQEITQTMGLQLEGINSDLVGMDLSALSGLRLGLFTSYNGAARWMSANLNAGWGEDELLELSMKADDAGLYFNSPQLTGNTHYGMNTETMGADLAARGVTEMEDVSFNMFDLVDMILERMDQEKLESDMKKAGRSLWDQAKVKKTGAKTLNIHGALIKTTAYQVVIPEEALNQYVDDMETALSALNYHDLYEEMFRTMGMPLDEVEDFLDALEDMDVYGELTDGLRDVIDALGDVELEVCLSDGYVSGVLYENEIGGQKVDAALHLGGGEEYVDDLFLEIKVDEMKFRIDSTGDHSLRSGLFTDTTTIQLNDTRSYLVKVTSDMTLDPSKKNDNFQWKLGASSSGLSLCVLDMAGDVTWSHDYLSLNPIKISVRAVGMEVCTLSLSYHVESHADRGTVEDPRLITQMDENELKEMVLDTQKRTLQWASDMEKLFMSRLPQELLWSLMSI